MSGFTDSNYNAMMDILPLYAKLITANEFVSTMGGAAAAAA